MGRYTGDSGLFSYAEYKNRGVIKSAPDALVFISSDIGTTVVAPIRGVTQKIDYRDGISNISIQNNVDPPGSSTASIEIIAPIQEDKDSYWVNFQSDDGRQYKYPFFVPMMEVKIFFRGRYLVNDAPQYYPAFWGFITNVEENYSGGVYKFNIQCADMLHWWSYIQVLFRPDVPSATFSNWKNLLVTGSSFGKANAFEIIYSLVQQVGFESFTIPTYLTTITPDYKKLSPELMQNIWNNMMFYWKKRFSAAANFLRMYGATGNLINDPTVPPVQRPTDPNHPDNQTIDPAILASKALPVNRFGIDDQFTQGFHVFEIFEKFGIDQAEYLSKLDVAIQVKDFIEYEFFQDVNGNFIFKPPYYNLNTKNILPYRIKPVDIINYSFGVNSEEIVTALEVQTGLNIHMQTENAATPDVGYHIDLDLTARFGERYKKITLQYLTQSGLTQSVAVGHLSKMNVNAYYGSVTIPGRPELKLGYPVYIEHKDKFYYVASINHSFDYGGSFTTTLSLKAERPRAYDLEGSQWKIQKSKIYKWQTTGTNDPNKTSTQVADTLSGTAQAKEEKLRRGANYIKSSEVGQYSIVKMTAPEQATIQKNTIPYTDEDGYKVIGSFRYGRGIVLKPGTVINNSEITISNLNISTPSDYNATLQTEVVTNMKAASDAEGSAMAEYFKENEKQNTESIIPEYMKTIPVDSTAEVFAVLDMKPNVALGIGGAPAVPLTAEVMNQRAEVSEAIVNSYNNAKLQGVPAYTGKSQTLAQNCSQFDSLIQDSVSHQSSKNKYPVSADLVKAVMMQESGGNTTAQSTFTKKDGSIGHANGLMQFTPATLTDMEGPNFVGRPLDANVPKDAIDAGVAYLGDLLNKFNGDETLALAAYNAGPNAVKSYGNNVPPYRETQNYVVSVNSHLEYLKAQEQQKKEANKQ